MDDKTILFSDLTSQHAEDIGRRIEMEAMEKDDLTSLFDIDVYPARRTNVKYRIRIPQPLTKDELDSFVMKENQAPKRRSVKYGTFTKEVKPYATAYEYTKEMVEDSLDTVVNDLADDGRDWVTLMKKYSAVKALSETNSFIVPVEVNGKVKINDTFGKAHMVIKRQHARKWSGNKFLAIIPSDIELGLSNELALVGDKILNEEAKAKIIQNYVGTNKGFDIMVPEKSDVVLEDENNYYLYFIGKTDNGRNPLRLLKKEGAQTETYHTGLGGGVIKDEQGNILADLNHQKGGIGINMRAFHYYVQDDRVVIKCTIAKAKVIDSIYGTEGDSLVSNIETLVDETSSSPVVTTEDDSE